MGTNPIIRYSDAELAEFKALIVDKLGKAQHELTFMQEQITEINENSNNNQSGNWFDDSSMHLELEMLNNMVSRQQVFVRNLENALVRIENKTYGICTVTGELIEKKRLSLVPHATKSVAAKEFETEQRKVEALVAAYPAIPEESLQEKEEKESRKTKIITKVIRKTGGVKKKDTPALPPVDDDWEMDLDLGEEDEEEDSVDDQVDINEIPDEDSGDY